MIRYCTRKFHEIDKINYYQNIYPSILQVQMCIDKSEIIYKIDVREAKENEETPYYGWLENNDNITMICEHILKFKVCFPYGYEAAEKRGQGKMIKVFIEEVGVV